MARPRRNLKMKKSLKQNEPSRIRIVYDDPDATDSSGDEGVRNPMRKRSVQEFLVASHRLPVLSSLSSSPSLSGHSRSKASLFRPWVTLHADETDAGESLDQQIDGERERCGSVSSAANDGSSVDGGCEAFMRLSPSSVLDVSTGQGEVKPAAVSSENMMAIGLPEPAVDNGVGLFWFESLMNPVEWTVDIRFGFAGDGPSTVEWASTAEVEKFFAN